MSTFLVDLTFSKVGNCDMSTTETTTKTEAIEIGTGLMIRTTIIVENFGSDNRYSSNIETNSIIIENMYAYETPNGVSIKEYDK